MDLLIQVKVANDPVTTMQAITRHLARLLPAGIHRDLNYCNDYFPCRTVNLPKTWQAFCGGEEGC